MDGAKLIARRRVPATDAALGIVSDAREVPAPSGGGEPSGWWIAGRSAFRGVAALSDQPDEYRSTTCEGATALAVTAERVVGIAGPDDEAAPAVWWSWSLSSLDIRAAGSRGLLRKRPATIELVHDRASIRLSAISRLHRDSGRRRGGQEDSLLKALLRR